MKKVRLAEYSVKSNKLSDVWKGYSFVMIADYHNNEYGICDEAVLEMIDEIHPDCIMLAGDMVVAVPGKDNSRAYRFIKALADKYTVYYGYGNHEYRLKIYPKTYGSMYREFLEHTTHKNIIRLENETAVIRRGGEHINVRGIEIDRRFYKRFGRIDMPAGYISKKVGYASKESYEILIAHNPRYFESYAQYGADLVLSGHVHGGLVRLPLLGGVLSPDIRFFPKYDYGRFTSGNATMLLTGGLGAHTLKIRMFNPPEIVAVRF